MSTNNSVSRRSVLLGAGASAFAGGLVYGSHNHIAMGQTLRERHSITELDASTDPARARLLTEYMDAFAKLKSDPQGLWNRVQNFHLIYCSQDEYDVHGSWRFLMWHRAYLASVERILSEISDTGPVTIPYWDWFDTDTFPPAFQRGALDHENRFIGRNDSLAVSLPEGRTIQAWDRGGRAENFNFGVRREFSDPRADAGSSFFGGPFVPFGAGGTTRRGVPEGVGHAGMHNYVGGIGLDARGEPVALGDMANLQTSARDPCFYSHHANVDRMIERWKKLFEVDMAEFIANAPAEFLDQEFVFYFDPTRIYRYRARDMLDPESLVDMDGVFLGFRYVDPAETEAIVTAQATPIKTTSPAERAVVALGAIAIDGAERSGRSASVSIDAIAAATAQGAEPTERVTAFTDSSDDASAARSSSGAISGIVDAPRSVTEVHLFLNVSEPTREALSDPRYLGTVPFVLSGKNDGVRSQPFYYRLTPEMVAETRRDGSLFVSALTEAADTGEGVTVHNLELTFD